MSKPQVFVVTGGMGASGEQLARTAMAQFCESEAEVTVVPRVRNVDDFRWVIEQAAAAGGIIIHTLVDGDLRNDLESMARENAVAEIDVMGPVLEGMAGLLGSQPVGKPGLYRKIREDYFRRVEAIEYAVRHDDGRRFAELQDADIVLTGVSRAGKTPLSMYLAMRGYKTANVPLVKGISPPEQLFEIDRAKVVGLTVDPERLSAHRRRRQRDLGVGASMSYSDPKEIFQDLEHARQVFRKGRFAIVDVTNKPIEESANEVVAAVTRGS